MRDVTEQMTAYFDATIERLTAEDVLAGADVRAQNGRLAPVGVPRLRPAWVVAAGFAQERSPVPSIAAREKAGELVREVFGREIAEARKASEKRLLIDKLVSEAESNDGAAKFALLKAALDIAPDAMSAVEVIDVMAGAFEVDVQRVKTSTIWRISKTARTIPEHKAVAEAAIERLDGDLGGVVRELPDVDGTRLEQLDGGTRHGLVCSGR